MKVNMNSSKNTLSSVLTYPSANLEGARMARDCTPTKATFSPQAKYAPANYDTIAATATLMFSLQFLNSTAKIATVTAMFRCAPDILPVRMIATKTPAAESDAEVEYKGS